MQNNIFRSQAIKCFSDRLLVLTEGDMGHQLIKRGSSLFVIRKSVKIKEAYSGNTEPVRSSRARIELSQ